MEPALTGSLRRADAHPTKVRDPADRRDQLRRLLREQQDTLEWLYPPDGKSAPTLPPPAAPPAAPQGGGLARDPLLFSRRRRCQSAGPSRAASAAQQAAAAAAAKVGAESYSLFTQLRPSLRRPQTAAPSGRTAPPLPSFAACTAGAVPPAKGAAAGEDAAPLLQLLRRAWDAASERLQFGHAFSVAEQRFVRLLYSALGLTGVPGLALPDRQPTVAALDENALSPSSGAQQSPLTTTDLRVGAHRRQNSPRARRSVSRTQSPPDGRTGDGPVRRKSTSLASAFRGGLALDMQQRRSVDMSAAPLSPTRSPAASLTFKQGSLSGSPQLSPRGAPYCPSFDSGSREAAPRTPRDSLFAVHSLTDEPRPDLGRSALSEELPVSLRATQPLRLDGSQNLSRPPARRHTHHGQVSPSGLGLSGLSGSPPSSVGAPHGAFAREQTALASSTFTVPREEAKWEQLTGQVFGGALRQKGTQDRLLALINELAGLPVDTLSESHETISRGTADLLGAEHCAFWFLDASMGRLVTRDETREQSDRSSRGSSSEGSEEGGDYRDVHADHDALVCICLRKKQAVSIGRAGVASRGLEEGDRCRELRAQRAQSLLAVPILQDGAAVGVAVLRNKYQQRLDALGRPTAERELLPCFTDEDVRTFQATVTFIGLLHRNASLFQVAKHQQTKAEAMLQMANQLQSAHLSQHTLVGEIMDAARALTSSDRCSMFIVDETRRELVAYLAGQRRKLRMPMDTGIAGHVATTGQPMNIVDCYDEPLFNTEVDRRTGYRTRTMLCMPVVYERSIVAVAQLINKQDTRGRVVPYTREDEELFTTFSTFAGVSLRNCKDHDAMRQSFARNLIIMDAATRMSGAMVKGPDEVIQVLISGARELANADRCSVFLVDKERDELVSTATDSKKPIRLPNGVGIAGTVCLTGQPENIADAYADPRFNPAFDRQMGYVTRTVLCFPIFAEIDGELQVVAVSQLINKLDELTGEVIPFTRADEESAADFAKFVGVMIMNNQLYQHAVNARNETMRLFSRQSFHNKSSAGESAFSTAFEHVSDEALAWWMSLRPHKDDLAAFKSREFDIHPYRLNADRGCMLVPLIVELFKDLGFIDKFGVPESNLYRFLVAARSKYRAVPYHNFCHAADVTQTAYCFLRYAGVLQMLGPLSSFVLLLTAVVHDIDHMGVNNSFHFKAETPMAILSNTTGSTSVLEVHHCNLTIEILSNPEYDVFCGLGAGDKKTAYKSMIDMILATDMARHKELCEYAAQLWKDGVVPEDAEHHKTLLQMVLKSADISNITKPFPVSEQWGMAVTEEFHQQGDKEKETIGHTMALFDREQAQELARGQLGFIDFMGLPYYTFIGSILPGMEWWVNQLRENRAEWQSQVTS